MSWLSTFYFIFFTDKYSMKYNFEFQITSFCQAKCASCQRTIDIDNFTPTHYPIEKFENTLNNLSSVDVDIITLCGEYGDPMMHPQIEEFIKLASNKGYEIELMTNGALRSTAFYKRLATTYSNLRIFFCIDGIDHDTNWKYREGVDFNKAWENMHSWFGNGGKGIWEMLVFTWNIHQIHKAHQIAKMSDIKINFKINRREGFPGLIPNSELENVIDTINQLH